MSNLFVVMNGDYDSLWAVALYESGELAEKHAEWISGWVTELGLSNALPAEVGDPIEVERRKQEQNKARAEYQDRQKFEAAQYERTLEITIDQCHRVPKLCSCCTFSDGKFITSHGYCTYCGGFTMETIRGKFGDTALQEKIGEEKLYIRRELQEILNGTRQPGLQTGGSQ